MTAPTPLSLTVDLGCSSCYAGVQIEVEIIADGGECWHVNDRRLAIWRDSHRRPWCAAAS